MKNPIPPALREPLKAALEFFAIIFLMIGFTVCLFGCNKQLIDVNYTFNYAIIELPNGDVVEGEVQSWTDFEDGDQLQIKIDGVTYLVHSSDVVLMNR